MLTKNRSVSLTLFLLLCTVFVLTSAVSASSHVSGGVSRRDHTNLKRFIKRRAISTDGSTNAASVNPLAVIGAASDPNVPGSVNGTTSSTNTTSSTSTSSTTTTTSSSTSTSATNSVTTTGNSTSTSTSTSTSKTSTSTTSSSTTSTSQTSQTSQTTPPASAGNGNSQFSTQVTLTSTATAQNSVETNSASNGGSLSSTGKTTLMTVLIVVAASVGGVAIIWTVFRKWKLSSSKKFDQRLEPINWQPTVEDDFIPHHRPGSDAASFHSGNENHSVAGYGATSNLTQGLDHDFTAGPSHLAPVGGYADLARGPSPQPHMQEALSRGPSLTRPNYDASVPLHHQNNYGVQDAYGRY